MFLVLVSCPPLPTFISHPCLLIVARELEIRETDQIFTKLKRRVTKDTPMTRDRAIPFHIPVE